MIPCPKCGADTTVRETRGAERRRMCKRVECGERLTTREVPVGMFKEIERLVRR